MAGAVKYSSAEICRMFNLAKSTLFRWEREGALPAVPRDLDGQRAYGEEHVQAILRKTLGRQYERALEQENEPALQQLTEQISLNKFLGGDVSGLLELNEQGELSVDTIKQVVRQALDAYTPGQFAFTEAMRLAVKQSQIAESRPPAGSKPEVS